MPFDLLFLTRGTNNVDYAAATILGLVRNTRRYVSSFGSLHAWRPGIAHFTVGTGAASVRAVSQDGSRSERESSVVIGSTHPLESTVHSINLTEWHQNSVNKLKIQREADLDLHLVRRNIGR